MGTLYYFRKDMEVSKNWGTFTAGNKIAKSRKMEHSNSTIPAPVKSPAKVFGSYLNEDLLAIHTVKLLWA